MSMKIRRLRRQLGKGLKSLTAVASPPYSILLRDDGMTNEQFNIELVEAKLNSKVIVIEMIDENDCVTV
jgi:hypothetical protein